MVTEKSGNHLDVAPLHALESDVQVVMSELAGAFLPLDHYFPWLKQMSEMIRLTLEKTPSLWLREGSVYF